MLKSGLVEDWKWTGSGLWLIFPVIRLKKVKMPFYNFTFLLFHHSFQQKKTSFFMLQPLKIDVIKFGQTVVYPSIGYRIPSEIGGPLLSPPSR